MKKLPCFILSRKESKGLKNKNTYKFLNKPLIQHTIDYAKRTKSVTDIVVSTDDPKSAEIANKNKCIVIYPRPKNLSNDNASSFSALYHAAKYISQSQFNFDYFCYLQITEPLRPKHILQKCIDNLKKNKKLNSSFAGYVLKKNFWFKSKKDYKLISSLSESYLPRQKRKPIYREDCGVALVSKKSVLMKKNKLYSKPFKIVPYESYSGLLDIHSKTDVKLGELIHKLI